MTAGGPATRGAESQARVPGGLASLWRISTFRVAALFGLLYVSSIVAMLALIDWQVSIYMEHRVDRIIQISASRFDGVQLTQLPEHMAQAINQDPRKIELMGLFDADHHWQAGNLHDWPGTLVPDGRIREFDVSAQQPGRHPGEAQVRALARTLPGGELLVVGRDISELAQIRSILLNGMFVGGSLILLVGLLIGVALSVLPVRRIRAIQETSRRIMRGDLSLRIPVLGRHDELDLLAHTVNLMLAEVERLLGEVKSVTDTVAHDLRTPLTRLRLVLYRGQQAAPNAEQAEVFERALTATDTLLTRFRALLRVSEIENGLRRAGFKTVDPREILQQLTELFEPLAEERGLRMQLELAPAGTIYADPELLLEALSNLVDNAIKFTPSGGSLVLRLSQDEQAPRIDIIDSGSGIAPSEREAVFQRFYRGAHAGDAGAVPGHGLGLSIVAAIIRLHGFELRFEEAAIGTHFVLHCCK